MGSNVVAQVDYASPIRELSASRAPPQIVGYLIVDRDTKKTVGRIEPDDQENPEAAGYVYNWNKKRQLRYDSPEEMRAKIALLDELAPDRWFRTIG